MKRPAVVALELLLVFPIPSLEVYEGDRFLSRAQLFKISTTLIGNIYEHMFREDSGAPGLMVTHGWEHSTSAAFRVFQIPSRRSVC